ncbi:MAG: hypothetical protein ACI4K7_02995 [Oscillospiraceae bacterium]
MNNQKQEELQKLMQEHPEINEKIKELHADSQSEMQAQVIELIKEYGVELTAEDFKAPGGELSDDELEAVSGGGGCACSGAGGGGGDYLGCACVVMGLGEIELNPGAECGGCICVGAGIGVTNWGDKHPDLNK